MRMPVVCRTVKRFAIGHLDRNKFQIQWNKKWVLDIGGPVGV